MNKKVGIVTYHKSFSYGGCLQAYATQLLVEKLGLVAEFIDYENPYESGEKSVNLALRSSIKGLVTTLIKKVAFKQDLFKRKAFQSFHQSLPLTKETYRNLSDLQDYQTDYLLLGSDQVWSPKLTGLLDPVFFLQFGQAKRKISLATSMGSYSLSEDEYILVKKYLGVFDYISVREKFAKNQIQKLTNKDVRVVLDPTLLITPSVWRSKAMRPKSLTFNDYILVFMVGSAESRYKAMTSKLKQHYGLPVVQVRLNSKPAKGVDYVLPATPFEFIWLIDHAKYVLTDSFHGMAFSINLETQFSALSNPKSNTRIQELVESCDLDNRLTEHQLNDKAFEIIDFTYSRKILKERRSSDWSWLSAALEATASKEAL